MGMLLLKVCCFWLFGLCLIEYKEDTKHKRKEEREREEVYVMIGIQLLEYICPAATHRQLASKYYKILNEY